MNRMHTTRGFTLIELIIAVTIITILAAIAIPNYRGYVLRANRTDAMTALLHLASAQEKFYMQNNTYTTNLGPAGLNIGTTSTNDHYTVQVTSADANGFDARAYAPDETTGQGLDAQCTEFQIDEQGNKTATGNGSNPSATCWR